MDKRIEESIRTQQKLLVGCRLKTNSAIPRRNDIIKRAEEIYRSINVFSMFEPIAFVDFNSGEAIICKEVGEITLSDLMEIANDYTLGKMVTHDVRDITYIAAYCRKLNE